MQSRSSRIVTALSALCLCALVSDLKAQTVYSVGTLPTSVEAADLDGVNGKDLIVANGGDGDISVLLNNGDGTFSPKVDYTVAPGNRDIIALDFNADNKVDVAVLAVSAMWLLLGNGDGTLQAPVQTIAGGTSGSWSMEAGDVDNDNDIDLLFSNWNSDNASVMKNDSAGNFSHYQNLTIGDNPREIAVADINGDNMADIMVNNIIAHTVGIRTSQGTFFDNPVYVDLSRQASDLSCVDINADTKLDLVVTLGGTFGGYEIFLGDGLGGFGAGVFTDSLGYLGQVEVADINGDTYPDIIAVEATNDSILIAINNGAGGFSAPTWVGAGGPGNSFYSMCVEDLDGDTKLDLVFASYTDSAVFVMTNDELGSFPTAVAEDEQEALPQSFELGQNYPNPFNPETKIEYSLVTRSAVTIEIFSLTGQRVKLLVNRVESAGTHTVTWDGTNASGDRVASGVYLYRITAGKEARAKKMLLLK